MPGRSAPIALIWKIKLFSGLSDKELASVAAPFQDESYEPGSLVVEEGTTGSGFFVMESGRAMVSVRGQELRELGAGDHFGEIALIADSPRTATVTAVTNLRCHTISRDDFRNIVEAQPTIAWKLLENLARDFVSLRQSVD
jgi:CRP-like cAMP-binding protein